MDSLQIISDQLYTRLKISQLLPLGCVWIATKTNHNKKIGKSMKIGQHLYGCPNFGSPKVPTVRQRNSHQRIGESLALKSFIKILAASSAAQFAWDLRNQCNPVTTMYIILAIFNSEKDLASPQISLVSRYIWYVLLFWLNKLAGKCIQQDNFKLQSCV